MMEKTDIWSALAAPLPAGLISWRQDGRAITRDGRFYARFVAYIDANTVRERLDGVVPGEWDLTLDLLPLVTDGDDDGASYSFKARLQILGVIREDVGTGRDYKQAATDAFKRAAVRFGIAHELYAYEQNWVQVDGDGRYARPLEDPQAAYARRIARDNGTAPDGAPEPVRAELGERDVTPSPMVESRGGERAERAETSPAGGIDADAARCPKCDGRMWDNRISKRNPKAPDFKCRDRSCDGVIWPPKGGAQKAPAAPEPAQAEEPELVFDSSPLGGGGDEIPF
jgi:hypothetical protein